MVTNSPPPRTQTGLRLSSPLLKVLKGLAEYKDMTLGDLVEGIVLHAFDNKLPFSEDTLETIARLGEIYGLEQTSADSHMHPDRPVND